MFRSQDWLSFCFARFIPGFHYRMRSGRDRCRSSHAVRARTRSVADGMHGRRCCGPQKLNPCHSCLASGGSADAIGFGRISILALLHCRMDESTPTVRYGLSDRRRSRSPRTSRRSANPIHVHRLTASAANASGFLQTSLSKIRGNINPSSTCT